MLENRWAKTKQILRFAYPMNDLVVYGAPSRSAQDDTVEFSGIQSAALLGDAVLANGPVFIGEAGLYGLFKDFGEIVGEAETGVAGGGSLAQHTCVFGSEADA